MLRFPVKARTLADLKRMAQPQAVPGGSSEALVWAFHDTAMYDSGVTTSLTFFSTTRATRNLSNLSPAGTIPDPQFFEIYGFHVDFLIAAVTTSILDVQALVFGDGTVDVGGPVFTFTYADKTYGPWALSLLHGTGGVTGFTADQATPAEYANVSIPDGGFYQDGAIVLAPNQSFSARIDWGAAVTLTADVDVRVTMSGVLHRRVV